MVPRAPAVIHGAAYLPRPLVLRRAAGPSPASRPSTNSLRPPRPRRGPTTGRSPPPVQAPGSGRCLRTHTRGRISTSVRIRDPRGWSFGRPEAPPRGYSASISSILCASTVALPAVSVQSPADISWAVEATYGRTCPGHPQATHVERLDGNGHVRRPSSVTGARRCWEPTDGRAPLSSGWRTDPSGPSKGLEARKRAPATSRARALVDPVGESRASQEARHRTRARRGFFAVESPRSSTGRLRHPYSSQAGSPGCSRGRKHPEHHCPLWPMLGEDESMICPQGAETKVRPARSPGRSRPQEGAGGFARAGLPARRSPSSLEVDSQVPFAVSTRKTCSDEGSLVVDASNWNRDLVDPRRRRWISLARSR